MPVAIQIPSALRPQCEGKEAVEVNAANIRESLDELTRLYPKFGERLYTSDGTLNRSINIYVNDEDMRFLDNLDTPVTERDEVCIVLAIAGG